MFHVGFLLCIVANCLLFLTEGQTSSTVVAGTSSTVVAGTASSTVVAGTTSSTTTSSTTKSSTTKSSTLPDYIQYSCITSSDNNTTLNQIVIAKNVLNVSDIYAYKVNNMWDECRTNNSDTQFIILNCWNYDVIVAPRSITNMIIGGRESKLYQLKCVGPDSTHKNVTVDISKSIKYGGSANVYGMGIENAYVFDMKILDHHNQTKDTYLIGDLMIMQIIARGDHKDIQWRVLSCTAYSAPVEIEFVKDAKVVPDTRIVGEEQQVSQALYQIGLYAFHGVHNNDVTYTCTIEMCLNKAPDQGCLTRRRRSADNFPTIHTAKVKISVYDRIEDNAASGAFQSSLSMTAMCGASLLMWIYK